MGPTYNELLSMYIVCNVQLGHWLFVFSRDMISQQFIFTTGHHIPYVLNLEQLLVGKYECTMLHYFEQIESLMQKCLGTYLARKIM